MSKYILETVQRTYDDVPWNGHGEVFDSIESCKDRIDELERKAPLYDEISFYVTCLNNNEIVYRRCKRIGYLKLGETNKSLKP